ncbi:MAG: carbamoyltransferase HypF [Saprospiraceae bacterium]|nr:carbamoyltransferase HypF [Saprospiraceae bacterium]
MKQTYHIHITGQVQGVGFRPYVFRLAVQFGLKGWVNNAPNGVHIRFNANTAQAKHFYNTLIQEAPALAHILTHQMHEASPQFFDSFEIIQSEEKVVADLLLTPDFALCEDCRRELYEPTNRRFHYPFITCTNCGPRFSIIQKLPYDRERTTMLDFTMCNNCEAEYHNVWDRRYFSQTNSCPTCGIQLQLMDAQGNILENPLQTAIQFLQNGQIGAVKGIGGYLLLCDATNAEVIQRLRERKHRPTKPLALLYANVAMLEGDVEMRDTERKLLQSPAAPIILLNIKESPFNTGIQTDLIAPGLRQIGAMLPYTPLFDLISNAIGKPLVATSGNVSGSPVIYEDEKALQELLHIADFILSNNRDIILPQDDSVMRISTHFQQPIVMRRSRGLAPSLLNDTIIKRFADKTQSTLAMGAHLKSTFSLLHRGNVYVSQFLGDLDRFESQQSYEHTLHHFLQLFDNQPRKIITDKHPAYFSTQLGEQLAAEWNIPLIKVQHHQAHALAVLGENHLLDCKEPVLNIIWDGTGYGDDGQVWGGEFFYYKNHEFSRAYHFDYFPFILGDKMPREPRISVLCLAYNLPDSVDFIRSKFSETEWNLYQKLLQKPDHLKTSSVGRLFDGVASLLGLGDKMSYEGEAAMQLEALAKSWFHYNGLKCNESYITETFSSSTVPTNTLVQKLLSDLQEGRSKDYIAAKFLMSLVSIIKQVAYYTNCRKLAFSGGVFQNELLVDLILYHLKDEFELFFHQQLSPNDECISFGQLINYE